MPAERDKPDIISSLQRYYRFHSKIYDLSRWAFLFGRKELIKTLTTFPPPKNILEIGCGTGSNLLLLQSCFPDAELTGVDISDDMLKIAGRKLSRTNAKFSLIKQNYDAPIRKSSFDIVIFSYCLSMINPGWEDAILAAKNDLSKKGILAVVDFNGTDWIFFRKWMAFNHVRMDYQIPDFLSANFVTKIFKNKSVYSNTWDYFLFIGENSVLS